jgi:hypothetical protein
MHFVVRLGKRDRVMNARERLQRVDVERPRVDAMQRGSVELFDQIGVERLRQQLALRFGQLPRHLDEHFLRGGTAAVRRMDHRARLALRLRAVDWTHHGSGGGERHGDPEAAGW